MPECPVVRIKSTHPESQGDFVEVNASDFDPAVHERFIDPPPAPVVPPPPPPPPPQLDPLANLPANWRDRKPADLRALAQAVSGGRVPENTKQAVEMIEAALAARK